MVKIKIDRDGCISCGACWGICSNVYEQNVKMQKAKLLRNFRQEAKLLKAA